MVLGKDAIMSVSDIEYEDVYIKEWAGTIRLYVLSAGERLGYESKFFLDGKLDFKEGTGPVELIALCMRNEDNVRLFGDDQVNELKKKNANVITMLFKKCISLNWLDEKSVIEAKKN